MLYTPNKQLQGFQALKLHSTKGKDTTKFLQLGLQTTKNKSKVGQRAAYFHSNKGDLGLAKI